MEVKFPIEAVSLEILHDHPRQAEFFAPPTQPEIEELASDLQRRGQQEPIHICPDGTILCGHRRVLAAAKLKWKTIKAIIRQDLPDPLSKAAVDELITDNLIRQQLDELALARCYHELKKSSAWAGDEKASGDARDHLATRLKSGKSGRTLDRLERLLTLPRDVQDMISTGRLNKSQAEKILQLANKTRDALIDALRREERVVDVLRRYGVIKPVINKSPSEMGEELLRYFRANLKLLSRNIRELDRLQIRGGDVVKLLEDSTQFMSAWADRKRNLKKQALDSISSNKCIPRRLDKLSGDAR